MERRSGNREPSTLRICIDKASAAVMEGRVLGMRLSQPIEFSDLGDMMLRVDELLNRQGFPQAYQKARVFLEKPPQPPIPEDEEGMSEQAVKAARGAVFTCDLLIRTRQNSTWQGAVDWLDGSEIARFFSALELLRMIDARLSGL